MTELPRISGVNHIVVPTSDMQRTLDFYCHVLGLELAATTGLSEDDMSATMVGGQQTPIGSEWKRLYFFDLGGGTMLGFLEFPDLDKRPEASYFKMLWPGSGGSGEPGQKMDHLAFNVESLEDLLFFQRRLREHGYETSDVNAYEATPFVKSVYFYDPNGLALELSTHDRADPRWQTRTPDMFFADPEPLAPNGDGGNARGSPVAAGVRSQSR
jgi:catechol 2,3-dioxygenase-like lactoylglutathione lyase family enzyme